MGMAMTFTLWGKCRCSPHMRRTQVGSGDLTGPQRNWFLRQMELDTAFLRDLNLMDYSLLVAFQLLREDEKDAYTVYSTMR